MELISSATLDSELLSSRLRRPDLDAEGREGQADDRSCTTQRKARPAN